MGAHRAVPADRGVRPLARAAGAAVRRRDSAVQGRRTVAGDAAGVRCRPTVHNRFRHWRDAGVFEALLEDLIAEAAKRGAVDLSLVSIDSTARAHHDAVGMHLGEDVLPAQEKAAAEEEKARPKGAATKEQNGQDAEADPEWEERRRIRRLRKFRLKAALLGRSRGADQQGQPRRRPEVPPAGVRPDREPGRGQPADHPRAGDDTGPRTRRPAPHSAGRGRRGQGLLVPR